MSEFFYFFILFSCSYQQEIKHNEPIIDFGKYRYADIEINVFDVDGGVHFAMTNTKGDTLVVCDRSFSKYQRWALQLDQEMNLWVFSSDIGDSCWKNDKKLNRYTLRVYEGLIDKDSIPEEVYRTLSKFHPYSTME